MKDKIKILFIPYLGFLFGLIGVYSFLHWLIFIKLELFAVKEVVINFGLPIFLSALVAWLLLRPRFKVLNLEAKSGYGNWRDFYSAILWLSLLLPFVISQNYIVSATGKLTALQSINEIHDAELTKYYTLENFYFDKEHVGVHTSFEVSGKHNEHLNMYIYVAIPIFEKQEVRNNSNPLAWLGYKFHKSINNKLSQAEKETAYHEFTNQSQTDFDRKDFSNFVYLDRIAHSDTREGYLAAVEASTFDKPNELIFEAVNESFESRNGKQLEWIIGSSLASCLLWLLMISIPKVDEKQLRRIKAGKPDKEIQEDWQDFVYLLKPREGYFFTPILIYANIGMFILMLFAGLGFVSFKGQDLITWGANYGPLTKDGEWWRLFTCIFLHGGVMHLLANMYGLLFVGMFLEPLIGKFRFILLYLATGILASLASIWWYDATISVGASGAIFGLYGTFLALLSTKIFPKEIKNSFLLSTAVFVVFNLLAGISGGIDNAAHIGGLVSGLLLGYFLYALLEDELIQ